MHSTCGRIIDILEKWLAMEHSIHAPGHTDE
jgi:hypothetical protein